MRLEILELEKPHLVSKSQWVNHPDYFMPVLFTQYGWSDGKTTVWNKEFEIRKAQEMTTFTTEDRQDIQTLLFENANLITQLQEKVKFLETKNKWLMQQVEQLEIQLWGSR